MEEKEIPALGRPFDVGMLYDFRTNNLITDKRVWNEQSIKQHTTSQSQPQCDFDFTAEDTISSKTSFLDINANLKLSLFLGWIEVHGSAKYLENHRTFTRQSRVSFKYRCRTHFKELRINELMSEQQGDRRVLDSGNATHVVTGILYGIDAIFVFDRNTTDNEDKLQIQKKLEAMIKFLPKASKSSNIDEQKNKLLDNVKVTYHGDITFDFEPSSFEEAVKLFQTLPSKLGQKAENCVPMNIWLYPLNKVTSKKVTLNEPLHVTLINQIQDKLEKIQVLKMKCNDLTARPTCQYDETYRQKVDEMQKTVEQSEQKLKSKLSSEVTAARSINLVKGNVRNLLDEYERSPKSPEKLDSNLSKMRNVVNVLDTCVEKIQSSIKKDTQSNTNRDFKYQLSNYDKKFKLPHISCFLGELEEGNCHTATQQKQHIRKNMLIMRNRVKKDIDTFISKLPAIVEHYKNKHDTNTILSLLFQPGKPSVIRSFEHEIEISWQAPLNVSDDYFYEISYRCLDQDEWINYPTKTSNTDIVTVSFLQSNTYFVFRVRCECGGVFGEYSEVSNPIKTECCVLCNNRFVL